MVDYTTMSDADLLALVKPTAPAAPDYSKMTDEELLKIVKPSAIGRAASIAGAGLARGVTGLAGLPGAAQELVGKGMDYLTGRTLSPEQRAAARPISATPEALTAKVEGVTGKLPTPETTAEKYLHTGFEFLPGALAGPGGMIRKGITQAAIPGAASEWAGQRAEGTGWEPAARIAGALVGVGGGAGVNAALTGAQNRFASGRTAGELSNIIGAPVSAGAARRLASSAEADALTPAIAAQRAGELGPEAMLLDAGRQLRGRAEAVASQPGRGQNAVLDAVEGRTGRFGEATAQRVAQTLDREMGQTHNVVELRDRVHDVVNRIARPLYDQVMGSNPVVAVPAKITARPAVAAAMKDAVTLAKQYGETLSAQETKTILKGPGYHIAEDVTQHAQPSLRYWDYVKKTLDKRINSYMKSGGTSELASKDKADLGGLMDARRALVTHLDDVTNGEYANARQAMSTKYDLDEALDIGRAAFNTKMLPEEFAETLHGMSIPERAMAQTGFRRQLDHIIEATRNEGATARRVLDTNAVLQKAEVLFGPQAVRAIERRIGAETTFQEATQDIARNSRTAVRQELIKDTSTPSTSALRSASLTGLALGAGRGGLNYLRQHGMENTRGQIADVLTARGQPQIESIVNALTHLSAQRARPRGGAPGRAAIIDALIAEQGAR